MNKKRTFLKQFFKEKKTIGAISPSSRYLAKKMLDNIDFNQKKAIVELGPGTGVFTRKILKKLAPDGILIVFELHEPFYHALKKEFANDSRVKIISDSAEKLNEYLSEHKIEAVDIVLSSLPLANFNQQIIGRILWSVKENLKDDGLFIQFQYSLKSKKSLEKIFSEVSINFTPRNIPPAFIYTCKK